ncbi:helix-turn-helix domain-containing protein [Acinetobacter baylyi]|uniref:helix-turn-helix domain-containing protein n=1 Tax=Acinetobacter baylyi TaxID=202950 RepID=UPI000EA23F8A|nr:helix-turn-helix domain-containing protein [Acinetobacter baylyi]
MNIPLQIYPHKSSHFIKSYTSENIYEYSKLMTGWEMELNQYAEGKFRGELKIIEDHDFQIVYDKSNISLQKNAYSRHDLIVTLPLNQNFDRDKFYCQGNRFENLGVLIAQGRYLPELVVPQNAEIITIGLSYNHIERYIENSASVSRMTSAILPRLDQKLLNELSQLMNTELLMQKQSKDELNRLKDIAIDLLSQTFDQQKNYFIQSHIKKQIVDQAKDFMCSQSESVPSIIEVCQQLGVSRRKLQYCFQEVLGINPNQYFKIIRLNQVYRCLSQGVASVQDVAYQWGFWHLGHFSADYKKLFGELPSTTLAYAKLLC